MDTNRTGNDVLADSAHGGSATNQLTHKEQLVIAEFAHLRPGTGAIALQNIQNPDSGWREIIAQMSDSEIQVTQSLAVPNSFCYRHIH